MRRLVSALALTAALAALPLSAKANELCNGEFRGLLAKHGEVMKSLSSLKPAKDAKNIDEARASAQRACVAFAPAVASFERLQAWVSENKDFCMLPPKIVGDVAAGLTSMKKNRAGACSAVAKLDQAKRAGAGSGGDNFPPNFKAGVVADDPFNPRIVRRPQIDTAGTPGS